MQALINKVTIILNGSPMEVSEGTSISDLLQVLEIGTVPVAVEQNLEIVPKAEYMSRKLSAGDRVEIVHFVGGG